uniref:Probable endolytic peptidoglycan transglycosylase RlpA n=1 Tax=Desulfobacca acetoxidans TaxID=60893 RepID=A0A7V6A3B9_9BACT
MRKTDNRKAETGGVGHGFCYGKGQEEFMIALIPGITASLNSLQSPPAAAPSPRDGFSRLLHNVSRSLSSPEPPSPAPATYTVQPGDNLSAIARKLGFHNPEILAQVNNLKNPDQLQIGQVLTLPEHSQQSQQEGPIRQAKLAEKISAGCSQAARITSPAQGRRQLVSVSWYGSQHQGKLMANGRPFNMYADTVAHKSLPLGTRLTLTNPATGAAVKVQVTDRGPYVSGRSLDLSYSAARKLGVVQNGVSKVWMEGG